MEWETHGNGIIFYSLGNMVASQAYSNTSLESCRKVSCGEKEVLATQCRARTGTQKEECCTQCCKHLLQSDVVMSFDLVASADGAVRFSCFNYTATTSVLPFPRVATRGERAMPDLKILSASDFL